MLLVTPTLKKYTITITLPIATIAIPDPPAAVLQCTLYQ